MKKFAAAMDMMMQMPMGMCMFCCVKLSDE